MSTTIIEQWKIKKLICNLRDAEGNGTSMISLAIPPHEQLSRVNKMLAEEYGTATNIKSRVNRLSVLSAITSAQMRLKLYRFAPPNGLLIYVGAVNTEKGEKKMSIDFEPFKPINTSMYLCDNRFHTEILEELLTNDETYGFVVVDGNEFLLGTLCGNSKAVLHADTVNLPKKHNKGGQSSARFGRLREEMRHNYVRKVAEICNKTFISADHISVLGLVFAGSAEFKEVIAHSDILDQRLKDKVIKIVDIPYGGDKGFSHAIEQCTDVLKNVRFVKERKLLSTYFQEIARNTGKVCYGIKDVMYALEAGAVDKLIVWEHLNLYRITRDDEEIEYKQDQHSGNGAEHLLEWLIHNFNKYGTELEIISDHSEEGMQFVKGFGGMGALLRYQIEFELEDELNDELEGSDDIDDLLNDEELFI